MDKRDYQYRIYRADGLVFEDVMITLGDRYSRQNLTLPAGLRCTVIVITDATEIEKLWWKTEETGL